MLCLESLDDVILWRILSFFVAEEGIDEHVLNYVSCVCKRLKTIANSGQLWRDIPLIMRNGRFNLSVFQLIKKKVIGSEGTTFKTFCRPHQRVYALRRCRAYPSNCESVPYYLLRSLAALRRLNHPNITELLFTSLDNEKIYTVYCYAEQTVEDVLLTGTLSPAVSLSWLTQLTEGLSCLHSFDFVHRNLKPKHLLVFPGKNGLASLEECTLKIADFMAVRYLPNHQQPCLTPDCVSLWYRSPELLMGERQYGNSVDMWSLGAIFAEMIVGLPLFRGMTQIEQLFQIFSLLGTPLSDAQDEENDENNSRSWTAFNSMPNFQNEMFPKWKANKLSSVVFDKSTFRGAPERQDALDLLGKLLVCDPSARITAAEALRHPLIRHPNNAVEVLSASLPSSHSQHRQSIRPQNSSRTNNSLPAIQWESTVDWLLDAADNFRGDSLSSSQRREYLSVLMLKKYVDINLKVCDDDNSTTWEQECLLYLAAACLHLASKLDDVCFLSAKDILRSLPNTLPSDSAPQWTLSRLLEQEEAVLNELQFDLYPTSMVVIDALLELIGDTTAPSAAVLSFMYLLGDVCLLFAPSFEHFPVRQLAASIYAYAARCFSNQAASTATAVDDNITKTSCYHCLVAEHARFYLEYRNSTLFTRFSRADNHEVSHVAPRR